MTKRLIGVAITVAGLVLGTGCGASSAPNKADPDQARAVLRDALEAWKKGETSDDLLARTPSVRVLDPDWQKGAKLISFEIGADAPFAAEQRVSVVLKLQHAGRPSTNKKVMYAIGTSPSITIVREEDS